MEILQWLLNGSYESKIYLATIVFWIFRLIILSYSSNSFARKLHLGSLFLVTILYIIAMYSFGEDPNSWWAVPWLPIFMYFALFTDEVMDFFLGKDFIKNCKWLE